MAERHDAKTSRGKVDLTKLMSSGHPVAWLGKLSWEIAEAITCRDENPAARIYKSMNCAVTAWHVLDWIWQFSNEQQRSYLSVVLKSNQVKSLRDFSIAVQRICPAIGLCRQIGTAIKHVALDFNRFEVATKVERVEGASHYRVLIVDGENEYVDTDVYRTALDVWCRIYVHLELDMWEEVYEMWPEWKH
ncbi:hypothetical protein [Pseudomonas putida]|uniref:hypothetical protein n=1 Tax=Pseudomonas putida TaxID=303 RepID=UPI00117AA11A|nr:hypothetical protein [Pseudomonas putida]